jgi:hypothetical protein
MRHAASSGSPPTGLAGPFATATRASEYHWRARAARGAPGRSCPACRTARRWSGGQTGARACAAIREPTYDHGRAQPGARRRGDAAFARAAHVVTGTDSRSRCHGQWGSESSTSGRSRRGKSVNQVANWIYFAARRGGNLRPARGRCAEEPPAGGPVGEPAGGAGYSLSSGAPCTSRGCRYGLPLNRRMVASSTRRSAMATACAGDEAAGEQLLDDLGGELRARRPVEALEGERGAELAPAAPALQLALPAGALLGLEELVEERGVGRVGRSPAPPFSCPVVPRRGNWS